MVWSSNWRSIAIALVLTGNAQSLSAEETSLQATSPWLLRYDDDRCRAVREFGEGANLNTLWLDQSGLEPTYNLSIVGPAAKRGFGRAVTVQFGSEESSTRSYVRERPKATLPR
jgi:hypothetical protein